MKPAKRIETRNVVTFGDGRLKAECTGILEQGGRCSNSCYDGIFYEILDALGQMPFPPYITETLDDQERYQTVFAKERGSAAAPTAGLHFTEEFLDSIQEKGVGIAFITLHVGLGTFGLLVWIRLKTIRCIPNTISVTEETADAINEAKEQGRTRYCCWDDICENAGNNCYG